MNFLIDVHLFISLSKFLSKQFGCTAIHVNQILEKWYTSDASICKYADEYDFVVITKDHDFKNSHFISRTPKKAIRIALGNISNADLILIFEKDLSAIIKELFEKETFYMEINSASIILIA